MSIKCVVVATQTRARIFIQEDVGKELQEKADMINDSITESKAEVCNQTVSQFAREICSFLENNRSKYDKLILVSPPDVLVALKELLPERIPRLLVNSSNRELFNREAKEIQQYLKL